MSIEGLEQRIKDKIHFTGDDNECWNWIASKVKKGYGMVSIKLDGKWKSIPAHRYIFYFINGVFPEVVRHLCHNPSCCNPQHLIGGTYVDNMSDMRSANRQKYAQGEQTNKNILSNEDVIRIRKRFINGEGPTKIARDYPVTKSCISRITRNEGWKNLIKENN